MRTASSSGYKRRSGMPSGQTPTRRRKRYVLADYSIERDDGVLLRRWAVIDTRTGRPEKTPRGKDAYGLKGDASKAVAALNRAEIARR